MPETRRNFIKQIPLALSAGAAITQRVSSQETTNSCLDYGLSFIGNSAAFNSVRFWVESRTTIYDEELKATQVYYQCGSCKSENTFAERDLFSEDNYDFLPILGGTDWLIFRRPCHLSDTYRQVKPLVWGEPILKLRYGKKVRELDSFTAIEQASANGEPIVAQTEIRDNDTQLRAVIEYPVKTLNICAENSQYQVDTGPVAFPDLARRHDPVIDCLSLAFVAFNNPDSADFIIEQPTAVIEEEKEIARVYHYSNPFSLTASNRLLALELPD